MEKVKLTKEQYIDLLENTLVASFSFGSVSWELAIGHAKEKNYLIEEPKKKPIKQPLCFTCLESQCHVIPMIECSAYIKDQDKIDRINKFWNEHGKEKTMLDKCHDCEYYKLCHRPDKIANTFGGLECTEIRYRRKLMENKVIFESEEEARKFLITCVYLKASEKDFTDIVDIECSIREMKNIGVIRKSDLEILIEEAEETIKEFEYCKHHKDPLQRVELLSTACVKIYEAFQSMKAELNKRKC